MVMYDANDFFVRMNNKILFKIKFKKVVKYKFVIMCMFNTPNYDLYKKKL
jgi:hypothetical protein